MIAVIDTGGISALAPTDQRSRARLRALRARADDIVLPTAVLAEGVLTGHPGRDHHVRRLLGLVSFDDIGEAVGHAAGRLRTAATRADADPPPSGVDAMVVAVADQRASTDDVLVVTSDSDDIEALAVFTVHTERFAIQSV